MGGWRVLVGTHILIERDLRQAAMMALGSTAPPDLRMATSSCDGISIVVVFE